MFNTPSLAENKKAQNSWLKSTISLKVESSVFCPQILFSSATVVFRTNVLSLADLKSDLSRTNLKLPSSATWPS